MSNLLQRSVEGLEEHIEFAEWEITEPLMWTEKDGPPPAPQMIRELRGDLYRAIPAVNSGLLKWAHESARHLQRALMGKLERQDTQAFKVGRAIHCALLEPQNWNDQFVTAEQCCATMNQGKPTERPCDSPGKVRAVDGGWYCGRHKNGKTLEDIPEESIITEEIRDNCASMIESIQNTEVRDLLHLHTAWHECTFIWWERVAVYLTDGIRTAWILCKSRSDRVALDAQPRPINLDLKKAPVGGATDKEIAKKIDRYRWAEQQAHYGRGIEAYDGRKPVPVLLVVEDSEPFCANPSPIDDVTMKVATGLWGSCMRMLARGLLCDEWPGVFDPKSLNCVDENGGVVPNGMTRWALESHPNYATEEDFIKRGKIRKQE